MTERSLRRRKVSAMIAFTALLTFAALAPSSFTLDMGMDRMGAHAMVKLGRATVKFAFAFGHKCSETDTCPVMQS